MLNPKQSSVPKRLHDILLTRRVAIKQPQELRLVLVLVFLNGDSHFPLAHVGRLLQGDLQAVSAHALEQHGIATRAALPNVLNVL